MGRNGAGKTTLLKILAGVLAPDSGRARLGASVKMGYFAQQSLDLLDPRLTVLEQVDKDFPHASPASLRNLLGAFEFSGDEIEKPIRALSGGEKSRLVIARMLFDPPNFLVLDEPTNHLDLATKEMLVSALNEFSGTMVFVSHDRTFLRRLANRVLEIDSGGGEPTNIRVRIRNTWSGRAGKLPAFTVSVPSRPRFSANLSGGRRNSFVPPRELRSGAGSGAEEGGRSHTA